MGTSSSSSGPVGGVPFDPPWLNSVALETGSPLEQLSGNTVSQEQNSQQVKANPQYAAIAPQRRFSSARRQLGKYMNSGDKHSLKKALGSYSSKGMGGASNVAKRMKVSTFAGAGIFNFLQGVRDSSDIKVREWVNQLTAKNLSAYEIADEIINQVIPNGGSIEEESCRDSMAQALSNLLILSPDINLMKMDNENIWIVIELFIANEASNRINHDIGQLFESAKYTPREVVSRMNEMREYVKSEISFQIQELRISVSNPTKSELNNLLQTAIEATFEVFEEDL